ncbi:unnamed protein product, partial [Schistosoma intercalatum]
MTMLYDDILKLLCLTSYSVDRGLVSVKISIVALGDSKLSEICSVKESETPNLIINFISERL